MHAHEKFRTQIVPFWSASFISHPFFMRLSRRPVVAVLKEIDIR